LNPLGNKRTPLGPETLAFRPKDYHQPLNSPLTDANALPDSAPNEPKTARLTSPVPPSHGPPLPPA